MKTGQATDLFLREATDTIAQLRKKVKELERRGVLNAYPHFKTGTRKMFLNEPSDSCGKRKFHYVGPDPKKQKSALARIARWHLRERILHALAKWEGEIQWIIRDQGQLLDRAHTVKESLSELLSKVTPEASAIADPVTPENLPVRAATIRAGVTSSS